MKIHNVDEQLMKGLQNWKKTTKRQVQKCKNQIYSLWSQIWHRRPTMEHVAGRLFRKGKF